MIIAIDGPAGAGKSTVARAVAARLGFAFLDSGALYRAVVLGAARKGEPPELVALDLDIQLDDRILLDGEDVTEAIRSAEISALVPSAAARPALRAALTEKQRGLMSHGDWVAEGRDIGTVVAPSAAVKVFLTASPDERARRRARESGVDPTVVRGQLLERDRIDSEREHGPLQSADDAVEIDSTGMEPDEVVDAIVELVPPGYRQTPALFAVPAAGMTAPSRRGRR